MKFTSYITDVAIAEPEHTYSQSELADFMVDFMQLDDEKSNKLHALYHKSGIESRKCVLPDFKKNHDKPVLFNKGILPSVQERMQVYKSHALPLALEACRNLETPLQDITHLITVSCTGMYAPGLDIELAKALDLPANVYRTSVNFMGCYAALHAMKQADSLCKSTPEAVVLVVCVEICSIHFQPDNTMENWVTNMLFADGASSVIIRNAPNPIGPSVQIHGFNSMLLHNPYETMAWEIHSSGFLMQLSSYVPAIVEESLSKLNHWGIESVDTLICHPGGKKIIQVTQKSFDLPDIALQHSFAILRQRGNMSSPSVLYALHDFWLDNPIATQEKQIGLIAFGPGLTVEYMKAYFVHTHTSILNKQTSVESAVNF